MKQPPQPLVLTDTDPTSHTYLKKYIFDLSKFDSVIIRVLYRKYLVGKYKAGTKVNTLRSKFSSMPPVIEYLNLTQITLLSNLTTEYINELVSFLATTASKKTGKKYKYKSQYDAYEAFKSFVEWIQINDPSMGPSTDVFSESEFRKINRQHVITYFSDDIVKRIDEAVSNEENPYIKVFVSISRHTGLRMSDILGLSVDCAKEGPLSGYLLNYYNHKERRAGKPIPIPTSCYLAISNLVRYTEELREDAHSSIKNLLFIHRVNKKIPSANVGEIRLLTDRGIQAWVDMFAERHHITDDSGKTIKIRAHM